jgi:leucyl-tRNA synthetase
MEYKEALKRALYDFEIARNWYRSVTLPDNGGPGPHGDLIFAWIRSNALMLAPFTPHFSEHVWKNVLGETTSVQKASFPQPSKSVDSIKLQEIEYMRGVVDSMRSAEAVLSKRKGKAKVAGAPFDPSKPKSARVYVATEFPEWQNKGVELVRDSWNEQDGTIDDAKLRQALDAAGLSKDKKAMPFCQSFKVSLTIPHPCTSDKIATSPQRRSLRLLASASLLRTRSPTTLATFHQILAKIRRVRHHLHQRCAISHRTTR